MVKVGAVPFSRFSLAFLLLHLLASPTPGCGRTRRTLCRVLVVGRSVFRLSPGMCFVFGATHRNEDELAWPGPASIVAKSRKYV
uniref:Putative secreted protein n=1 Tax=Anopheles darlingi TaxID=43151 RepID=A0A2M4D698_ANODA